MILHNITFSLTTLPLILLPAIDFIVLVKAHVNSFRHDVASGVVFLSTVGVSN